MKTAEPTIDTAATTSQEGTATVTTKLSEEDGHPCGDHPPCLYPHSRRQLSYATFPVSVLVTLVKHVTSIQRCSGSLFVGSELVI